MATTSEQDTTEVEVSEVEEKAKEVADAQASLARQIARNRKIIDVVDSISWKAGWGLVALVILVLQFLITPAGIGASPTLILSGSMSGFIEKGDRVFLVPYTEARGLHVGDIAQVKTDEGAQYLHRVVALNEDGSYTTRGDANNTDDFFKAKDENIVGLYLSHQGQPLAGLMNLFSVNTDWLGTLHTAVSNGQWAMVSDIMPLAPWGTIIATVLGLFLWVILPFVLRKFQQRNERRARGEITALQETIARHEATLFGHDESINEIEPVVEEILHEREAAKAEKEASDKAMAAAWDNYDPTAPIYDEPEDAPDDDAFFDVYNKQFDTDIPSAWTPEPAEDSAFDIFETFAPKAPTGEHPTLSDHTPRFLPDAPTNPFDRLTPRVTTTRSDVTRASLRAEREQFAALGIRSSGQSRNEASAFDLEEI